jgi:hypothetical protein
MTRKKLSEDERIRRRRESKLKYNTKSRPQDTFIDLNHHPNALANLTTGELRARFAKELEDGTVQPSFRNNNIDELDYDPDEDFRGLEELEGGEVGGDRFNDDDEDGIGIAPHSVGGIIPVDPSQKICCIC